VRLDRRRILRLATGTSALLLGTRPVLAQAYPSRPVHILVGYAAGGPTDIAARLIGQWLSERLGKQFIIENRPGGGSNLATEAVVRSAPDGYTLLLVGASAAINATLYNNLSFNFIRDIVPIATMFRAPLVMVVGPSFPAHTVPEFLAYAKANPHKLNMASGGNGSPAHVSGELFKMMAGIDMVHVPYRGEAAALPDLLAGQVQVMFPAASAVLNHVREGKLRALAVTTATRSPFLPQVPALGEYLRDYEASAWYGIGAPRSTPADIVDKLNAEINAALDDPGLRDRIADIAGTPLRTSSSDFFALIAEETERWAKVIKFAGIKPE
jgi:tripartite-type tricarboxylate transporter receptor subunit TctC